METETIQQVMTATAKLTRGSFWYRESDGERPETLRIYYDISTHAKCYVFWLADPGEFRRYKVFPDPALKPTAESVRTMNAVLDAGCLVASYLAMEQDDLGPMDKFCEYHNVPVEEADSICRKFIAGECKFKDVIEFCKDQDDLPQANEFVPASSPEAVHEEVDPFA